MSILLVVLRLNSIFSLIKMQWLHIEEQHIANWNVWNIFILLFKYFWKFEKYSWKTFKKTEKFDLGDRYVEEKYKTDF